MDGMAVVQELSTLAAKTCDEFAEHFIRTVAYRARKYGTLHLIFDRYDVEQSLKQMTRDHRYGKNVDAYSYQVSDTTQIKVPMRKFLSSSKTKDRLTVYLANKTLAHFKSGQQSFVVSTKNGVQSHLIEAQNLTSNHEETDAMLILHALYAANLGNTVHILSPDTDVFVLAVRRQPQLGDGVCMIVGTGDKRRVVALKPIHDAIGSDIAQSLPGFHAFTGSDTTGKFGGKGKTTCWKALQKMRPVVLESFKKLGTMETPSQEIYDGLEEFVSAILSTCKPY